MKKIVLLLIMCIALAGCSRNTDEDKQQADTSDAELNADEQESDNNGDDADEAKVIEEDFGTYNLPAGWKAVDELSTDAKPFYISSDIEFDENNPVTNISVESGTNSYSIDEHSTFREEIMRQLSAQAGNSEMENFTGIGTNTDSGDILYVFKFSYGGTDISQYYIVGDYKYVLIYLTDFNDGTDGADDAVEKMAKTFVWAQ